MWITIANFSQINKSMGHRDGWVGSRPGPARTEAWPEGVLGDPDMSLAIFEGPEVDQRQFFLVWAIFFFLKNADLAQNCMRFRGKFGPEVDLSKNFRTWDPSHAKKKGPDPSLMGHPKEKQRILIWLWIWLEKYLIMPNSGNWILFKNTLTFSKFLSNLSDLIVHHTLMGT